MALQKTMISLDLVAGADTKSNPQIDTDFQVMENVVFTGNMTAKKMNGYTSLGQLPVGDSFSQVIRRKNDLLAMSNNGTYKLYENISQFKKISELGSGYVESNENPGKIVGFSTNYRCLIETKLRAAVLDQYISFYDHDGVLINRVYSDYVSEDEYFVNRSTKVLSIGDDFYICFSELGTGFAVIGYSKYTFNAITGEFENTGGSAGGYGTTFTSLKGLDFFTDGLFLYCICSDGTTAKSLKYDLSINVPSPAAAAFTNVPASNLEIFNRDASTLYVSLGNVSGSSFIHKLLIVNKSSMAITSTASLGTYSTMAGSGYVPFIVAYPLTDTSAVAVTFINPNTGIVGAGDNAFCYSPLGKIFLQDGNYYIPVFYYNFSVISTVVMKIVLESGAYKMYPQAVSDSGNVTYKSAPFTLYPANILTLNSICTHSGENYFTSYTPANQTTLVKFNSNAGQLSNYIEIEKSNVISNSLPSYFDGTEFQELGFLGCPQITEVDVSSGGSLPADTIQCVAIWEYTDALGNVVYSQYSNISQTVVTSGQKMIVVVQNALMTYKSHVVVKLYARKTNSLFQLFASKRLTGIQDEVTSHLLSSFPISSAETAPYQDTSIQPEIMTNSQFMGIYADRIFTLSKDNPISLSYSQEKVDGLGFEFNQNTFIIDVLEKRGIAEDDLTGFIAMDGRLIIFKENSILYVNGSGPSRANTSDDFSKPDLITTDAGCIEPRSIVLTPQGVMFKSDKGIYLLSRKLQVGYIGSPVEEFNGNTITSALLIEGENEVRFSTLEGEVLVYNYLSSAWSWFLNLPSLGACLWRGKHVLLTTSNKVFVEDPTTHKMIDGNVHSAIIQRVSTPWLKLNKVQGYQKAYEARILGDYKTSHTMTVKVFYDYELYPSEEYTVTPLSGGLYNIITKPSNTDIENGTAINGVYQFRIDLVRKNCQAFRLEITDNPLNVSTTTGESFALSNITVTVGIKKGSAKIPAAESF